MPNSTTDNQTMIGRIAPDALRRSGIHKGCRGFNDQRSFKQGRCGKSFVLYILVGYGLLQISSNLNRYDHVLVNAAQTNLTLQTNHYKDREIIILNSTNFNDELIQYQHPFPHIKVVEYYVPYCGICRKFMQTFTHLSKEIYGWRNVIRPAQLDMAVSYNIPIAQSWSIEVVPTLRIHPTPKYSLARDLDRESLRSRSMKSVEYQKLMCREYTSANLMTRTLNVVKYTNDSKIEDKVSALKHDLLSYIQKFVSELPEEIPATWPNLRPVTEKTLAELRLNHPRKELFLIVESGDNTHAGSGNDDHIDLGLQVIMELSSSAAWRAVRYLRVKDNKELLEDVISFKTRELQEHVDSQSTDQIPAIQEQLELLEAFRQSEHVQSNNLILIHIDDSYSSVGHSANAFSTPVPFLEVITEHDFVNVEEGLSSMARANDAAGSGRSKRGTSSRGEAVSNKVFQRSLRKRASNEDMKNLNLTRKIELAIFFVNQTYVPTREDEEFISALSKFDENPTSNSLKREASKKLNETQKNTLQSHDKPHQVSLRRAIGGYFSLSPESIWSASIFTDDSECDSSDYEDKLRAIRFIFLQEVPRQSFVDKSPTGRVEKLNTLINLAAVIKAYFPLPDSASVQFIDAIHGYLSSQLSQLLLSSRDRNSTGNFDFKPLRQFIKNIEAEGKRLPEINNWSYCVKGEFHCAIWRLFHTLTAFEYKKLTQISTSTDILPIIPSRTNHQTAPQSSPMAQIAERSASEGLSTLEHQNSLPSPVERVVSPPSATTSLSLTIVTPISNHGQHSNRNHNKPAEISELPTPVLLVMRDYVVDFFSCPKCANLFREETADLSFERIRHQEPAEFSILWLWETHNLISKRLSVSPTTNPPNNPKKWFPTYEQCSRCYKKPPSYLKDTSLEPAAIFHESIEWNRDEVLNFLQVEFTKQPMDTILLGVPMSLALYYSIIMAVCLSFLIVLLRCASYYIERQRRHKASMLNGVQYSEELQRC